MRVIISLIGLCLAAPAAAQTTVASESLRLAGFVAIVDQAEPPAASEFDMNGEGLAPPASAQSPRNKVAKELSDKVRELAGRREFDQAIALITAALAADGNNAELYRLRATIQCSAARAQPCRDDADKAVQADNEYVPAYLFRAAVRVYTGQAKEAMADCDAVIRISSTRPSGYNCRGVVYRALHDIAHAMADFDMALSKDPKFAYAPFNKGMTYLLENKPDDAIASFSAAIAINDKYDEAIAQRGEALVGKGDVTGARNDFTKALALNARNRTAAVGMEALQVAKALDALTRKN